MCYQQFEINNRGVITALWPAALHCNRCPNAVLSTYSFVDCMHLSIQLASDVLFYSNFDFVSSTLTFCRLGVPQADMLIIYCEKGA